MKRIFAFQLILKQENFDTFRRWLVVDEVKYQQKEITLWKRRTKRLLVTLGPARLVIFVFFGTSFSQIWVFNGEDIP